MKPKPIQFSLIGIKTEKFIIQFTPDNDSGNIEFGTQVQFFIDVESKTIICQVGLVFVQNKKEFLSIEVSCHFKISDLSWLYLYKKTKNQIVIPKGFAMHLGIITVGTTRGILFAKTENTLLNAYVIPTINLSEIIKSDVIIENLI